MRLGRGALPAFALSTLIAGVLAGAYAGVRFATHSPRFAIRELTTTAHDRLSEENIRALLALPEGANIFTTDMGSLEDRLIASPWIASAHVSRDLPSGLDIKLREQKPVAAVRLGGLYLVNDAGELFKRANPEAGDLDDLCIITGISREDLSADPIRSKSRLRFGLLALYTFKNNSDRPKIGELHLDRRHGISLITFDDAIAIHIGTPEEGELLGRYQAFDSAWQALDVEEHAAARSFRIADRTPSDRVTVAFAGN